MMSVPLIVNKKRCTATIFVEKVEPGQSPAKHFFALTRQGKINFKGSAKLTVGAKITTVLVETTATADYRIKHRIQAKLVSMFIVEMTRNPADFMRYLYGWLKADVTADMSRIRTAPWPQFLQYME